MGRIAAMTAVALTLSIAGFSLTGCASGAEERIEAERAEQQRQEREREQGRRAADDMLE